MVVIDGSRRMDGGTGRYRFSTPEWAIDTQEHNLIPNGVMVKWDEVPQSSETDARPLASGTVLARRTGSRLYQLAAEANSQSQDLTTVQADQLTADVASGATVLPTRHADFQSGDTISIDGGTETATVDSVDPWTKEVTISAGLTNGYSSGTSVALNSAVNLDEGPYLPYFAPSDTRFYAAEAVLYRPYCTVLINYLPEWDSNNNVLISSTIESAVRDNYLIQTGIV